METLNERLGCKSKPRMGESFHFEVHSLGLLGATECTIYLTECTIYLKLTFYT